MDGALYQVLHADDSWRVERIRYDLDGQAEIAIFIGFQAERRAKDYAAAMNRAELQRPTRCKKICYYSEADARDGLKLLKHGGTRNRKRLNLLDVYICPLHHDTVWHVGTNAFKTSRERRLFSRRRTVE